MDYCDNDRNVAGILCCLCIGKLELAVSFLPSLENEALGYLFD